MSQTRPTQSYDGVTDLVPMDLYGIHGYPGHYFGSRLAAEVRAREVFPRESYEKRYARVFFQRVFKEV